MLTQDQFCRTKKLIPSGQMKTLFRILILDICYNLTFNPVATECHWFQRKQEFNVKNCYHNENPHLSFAFFVEKNADKCRIFLFFYFTFVFDSLLLHLKLFYFHCMMWFIPFQNVLKHVKHPPPQRFPYAYNIDFKTKQISSIKIVQELNEDVPDRTILWTNEPAFNWRYSPIN